MDLQALWQSWFPFVGTLAGSLTVLVLVHVVTQRNARRSGFTGQVLLIVLTLLALVALITALPIENDLRGQLFSLLGVVVSATIALSSTTFVGNAMAGLMLRALQNFRPGDFVRVGDLMGRVSERGLFHTELQTEDSDLTTLPNLYLVTHPVTVVRAAGTIVSAQVSLGYDVPRQRIERALLEGAARAELQDAFVQVLELGDFSVLYRVAGLLEEVTTLLSARSRLRACALDALHEAQIEIVSPSFMNTRAFPPERRFVPPSEEPAAPPRAEGPAPEAVVFEKAEEAAHAEELRDKEAELARQRQALTESAGGVSTPEQRAALEQQAQALAEEEAQIAEELAERESDRTPPAR